MVLAPERLLHFRQHPLERVEVPLREAEIARGRRGRAGARAEPRNGDGGAGARVAACEAVSRHALRAAGHGRLAARRRRAKQAHQKEDRAADQKKLEQQAEQAGQSAEAVAQEEPEQAAQKQPAHQRAAEHPGGRTRPRGLVLRRPRLRRLTRGHRTLHGRCGLRRRAGRRSRLEGPQAAAPETAAATSLGIIHGRH